MDKAFDHKKYEEDIYKKWESSDSFKPDPQAKGKPFSIILPPPNANAPLHFGHALYVVEDILIRWHRMKGDPTLWVPGADHAGFETQVVYEQYLAKQGKSRFDFDQDTLYENILKFVEENRGIMEKQLRALGFSLDWSRLKFTLDDDVVATVKKTFKHLHEDGLLYRENRLVNYCTKHGTSFSNLEVEHIQTTDPLYYMKYGPFVLATVRPETKFGDTAVAVHPADKRYKKYIGKQIEVEGLNGKFELKVIADKAVDPEFGTGVVKVTPAHDFNDFEMAKRHNLPLNQVIDFHGRLNEKTGKYEGLKVKAAREKVVADLQEKGLIEKIDENYTHTVGVCYKCKNVLEPLPLPQWYIKTKDLAKPAIEAVRKGDIKITPKRFEKTYFHWMNNIQDWNISRQIVWGIRIPAWHCQKCKGWVVTDGSTPSKCDVCDSKDLVQDTDTFDTWFSSGQWPYSILGYPQGADYKKFYPTSVMETGYDILFFWVARMIMLGLYTTGEVPFDHVYLHGIVRDSKSQKMSKSKGNVVNPDEIIEKYGADALRMSLIAGAAAGNDQIYSQDKIRGYRNFANKVWNIARFVLNADIRQDDNLDPIAALQDDKGELHEDDKWILDELTKTTNTVNVSLEKYRLNQAAEAVYEFIWHVFADEYIEKTKTRRAEAQPTLIKVLRDSLKLLHPFMPYVTEAIWQEGFEESNELLINSEWPQTK